MLSLLFLQWLGCVLLIVTDAFSQGPGVLCFPWEILLCVAPVAFIGAKRYILRQKRKLARSHSKENDVHGKSCKKAGLTVQTSEDALKTPVVVANVPRLKTLSLVAQKKSLNTLSLNTEEFLKTVRERVPPRPSCHGLTMTHLQQHKRSSAERADSHQSQVTDVKQSLKTPANIQDLQKKLMAILTENSHLHQNLELLSREREERKRRSQELMKTRDSLERALAQAQEELTEKESLLKSLGETVLKANRVFLGLRDHLQRERATLQSQILQLKSENQKLQRKLQVLPEVHRERMKQLLKKSVEEQRRRLEIEERYHKVYENLNNVQQRCGFYQKMVKDMEEDLERTTFSCQNEILFCEERAQESWMATLSAKRQMDALRKDQNYMRQKLAHLQVKSKQIQRGHVAHRGPEVRGIPSQQVPGKEEGYVGRSQGLRVPRRFQ